MLIEAQPGAQTKFLNSSADFCIYGGSAGGGKTWGLLMEPLRHINKCEGFGSVIFRRTMPQITNEGGLWDESQKIYPYQGGKPIQTPKLMWRFPVNNSRKKNKVTLSQMQYEDNCYDWQGSQIPLILMDEITHFTEKQIFYIQSRNRSVCGVRPYMRGTCNPDPDHIVRDLIDWWIDNDTGLPILERSGVIRYYARIDETLFWSDHRQDLIDKFGPETEPISFTFIPASIYDNPALLKADPGYISKLKSLPLIERERLLGGNWNISANDGIINREWVHIVAHRPREDDIIKKRWVWDTASKEKSVNDPTVGTLWGETRNGHYLLDIFKDRVRYPDLRKTITEKFEDQPANELVIEDKSSGIALIQDLQDSTQLPIIPFNPGTMDKVERLVLASTWFETRNVFFWQGCPYLQECINELVGFKGKGSVTHDDFVDNVSMYLLRVGEGAGLGFSQETISDINNMEDEEHFLENKEW